jgi:osmotically-inducible protein OsmY
LLKEQTTLIKDEVIKHVHRALEHEPRINLHRHPVVIGYTDGAVILEGEVTDVVAKKLALELAGAVNNVRGVIDRLHVMPAERKGDGEIRDSLTAFLLGAAELRNCELRVRNKGSVKTLRKVNNDDSSEIEIEVENGTITLDGTVISLSHKRVAGVVGAGLPRRRQFFGRATAGRGQRSRGGGRAATGAGNGSSGASGADPGKLPRFCGNAQRLCAHRGRTAPG